MHNMDVCPLAHTRKLRAGSQRGAGVARTTEDSALPVPARQPVLSDFRSRRPIRSSLPDGSTAVPRPCCYRPSACARSASALRWKSNAFSGKYCLSMRFFPGVTPSSRIHTISMTPTVAPLCIRFRRKYDRSRKKSRDQAPSPTSNSTRSFSTRPNRSAGICRQRTHEPDAHRTS